MQSLTITLVLYRKSLLTPALGCWGIAPHREVSCPTPTALYKAAFYTWGVAVGAPGSCHLLSRAVEALGAAGAGHWGSSRCHRGNNTLSCSVSPAPSTDKASEHAQRVNLELRGNKSVNSSTQCPLVSVLPLLKLLLPKINTDQLIDSFPGIESFDLSTAYHHNDCPISYPSMLPSLASLASLLCFVFSSADSEILMFPGFILSSIFSSLFLPGGFHHSLALVTIQVLMITEIPSPFFF